MNHLTAVTVAKFMPKHGRTIHSLAEVMNVTEVRVRQVRATGVAGEPCVQDRMQAITGDHLAGWAADARAGA